MFFTFFYKKVFFKFHWCLNHFVIVEDVFLMKNHRNQLKHNQIHKGYPSFAENVVFRNANFENNNIVFRILKMHAFADKGYPL